MNPKRILARDRRGAAVHEAGHITIAARFGMYPVSAWIVRNDPAGDYERTWIGRVQFHQLGRLTPQQRRMVGVAGSVAEWLCGGGWIEDYFPEMSESDWGLAGCEPDEPDGALMDAVADVGELFERDGPGWRELMTEARRLVVHSRDIAA
jgi:hypothetical protein